MDTQTIILTIVFSILGGVLANLSTPAIKRLPLLLTFRLHEYKVQKLKSKLNIVEFYKNNPDSCVLYVLDFGLNFLLGFAIAIILLLIANRYPELGSILMPLIFGFIAWALASFRSAKQYIDPVSFFSSFRDRTEQQIDKLQKKIEALTKS
jgi:hypothetical protein